MESYKSPTIDSYKHGVQNGEGGSEDEGEGDKELEHVQENEQSGQSYCWDGSPQTFFYHPDTTVTNICEPKIIPVVSFVSNSVETTGTII